MTRSERYRQIVERFRQLMPEAATELNFDNAYQLIVAVILSAQCTDKRINQVTPALFEAYPTPQALAQADDADVYRLISSVSYPNNKTRSLIGMARGLCERFGSEVPSMMDELLSLPGVGRKTANVILSVVFGQPTMAVDTHVFRVSERLGLTTGSRSPEATERTLVKMLPREVISTAHHWLILHGRYVCKARKPLCDQCKLTDLCRHYAKANPQAPGPKPQATDH